MQVVCVEGDAVGDLDLHVGEALGGETVCATAMVVSMFWRDIIMRGIAGPIPYVVPRETYSKVLHVFHLILLKSVNGKLLKEFSPLPKGTPPLVGVLYGC